MSAASIIVTLLVAGLGPALVVPRLRVVNLLRQGGRSATTTVGALRRALLGAQLVFVCVLLIGAGLFAQSLRQVARIPLGIVRGELITTPVNLYAAGFAPEDLDRVTTRLRERVAAIPGVRGTSAAMGTNFLGQITVGLRVPGRDSLPSARRLGYVRMEAVTPKLFPVAGIALRSGRLFTDGDIAAGRRVVVEVKSFIRCSDAHREIASMSATVEVSRLLFREKMLTIPLDGRCVSAGQNSSDDQDRYCPILDRVSDDSCPRAPRALARVGEQQGAWQH